MRDGVTKSASLMDADLACMFLSRRMLSDFMSRWIIAGLAKVCMYRNPSEAPMAMVSRCSKLKTVELAVKIAKRKPKFNTRDVSNGNLKT